jgi:3-oxoacyl-[acyl-carrier-protein] synthase III
MFVGEIAIKLGIRGRTTLLNAGKLSAIAALASGVRLIERGRAPAVLVVAAEAVGPASRDLDFDSRGQSGAAAWLLAREGEALAELSNARYGVNDGEKLAEGDEGFGLTYIASLERAMLHETGRFNCGEGADAITLDLA